MLSSLPRPLALAFSLMSPASAVKAELVISVPLAARPLAAKTVAPSMVVADRVAWPLRAVTAVLRMFWASTDASPVALRVAFSTLEDAARSMEAASATRPETVAAWRARSPATVQLPLTTLPRAF